MDGDERPGEIRAFIRGQSTLSLATIDSNGEPRCTPLFFMADDSLRVYWFSSSRSVHSRNCMRSAAASVAVYYPTRAWQQICGVQMKGSVAQSRDQSMRSLIMADFVSQFRLVGLAGLAIRRSTLYCFTPWWLRFINNARGFGAKLEFRLQ